MSASPKARATSRSELATKRRPDPHVIELVGRMETELRGAQLAHASMMAAVRAQQAGAETSTR